VTDAIEPTQPPEDGGGQLAALALPPVPQALEAVLMVVDEPVTEVTLAQVLERPTDEVSSALQELAGEYDEQDRGFELRRVAGGWRFYTRAVCAPVVERFVLDGQHARLTQAALETLAVVAYRQPVSRARISAVRGVNVDGVMRTLLARGLVEEAGSDGEAGATLYRTTSYFLERMGLDGLHELPDLAPFLPELDTIDDLGAVLEALLLVVDTPVPVDALAAATEQPAYRISAKLVRMAEELAARDSGIDLREAGGGWRMYTRARYAPYVERLVLDGARSKLTRAALETLAVVAYRQPVTRARVSAVRGVNVDAVMRTLLARGLITEAGTDPDSGAVAFATTELFLERLGLSSLTDLPDIAPLLPDVDVIDDLTESLGDEPRFAKLGGARAAGPSPAFDVDRD